MSDPLAALLERMPLEPSEASLQLLLSIMQEHRKVKEAEKSAKQEERKVKELELEILKEKRALAEKGGANGITEPTSKEQFPGVSAAPHPWQNASVPQYRPQHTQSRRPGWSQNPFPLDPTQINNQIPAAHPWNTLPARNLLADALYQRPSAQSPNLFANVAEPLVNSPATLYNIDIPNDWVPRMSFTEDLFGSLVEDDAHADATWEHPEQYTSFVAPTGSISSGSSTPGHDSPNPEHSMASMSTITTGISRRRRKRAMKEIDAICFNCSELVAHLYLHGTDEELEEPYTINVQCVRCAPREEKSATSSAKGRQPRKRKEGSSVDASLSCDVCKRKNIGIGGVQSMRTGQSGPPAFAVEVVCAECHSKYALCSDCGGGGKFRTGKWRPVQLFATNRVTCSLSHERYGIHSEAHTNIWRVYHHSQKPEPQSREPPVTEDVISSLLASVHEVYLFKAALPKVMEAVPSHRTWSDILARLEFLRTELEQVLRGTDPEMKVTSRRYLTARWVTSKRDVESISPNTNERRLIFAIMTGDWDVETGDVDNIFAVCQGGRKRQNAYKTLLDTVYCAHAEETSLAVANGKQPPPTLRWIWLNVHKSGKNNTIAPLTATLLREQGFRPMVEVDAAKGDFKSLEDITHRTCFDNRFEIWVGRFEDVRQRVPTFEG